MQFRLLASVYLAAIALCATLGAAQSAYAAAATDMRIRAIGTSFRTGRFGRYNVTVSNHGTVATDDDIHVLVTLPPGISFVSQLRFAWDCSTNGQNVDCVRHDPLGRGRASTVSLVLAVCTTAPSVVTTFQVVYAGDTNPTNDTTSRTTTVHPGQLCVAGTPTPPFTPGTPPPTRTPTIPGVPTNTPTPVSGNPNAPVVTSFTCNGASQCSVSLGQSFTLRFSFTDANANAVSYKMTARRDDGFTSDASDGTFGGPTAGQTITLNFPAFTCDQSPCRQATFDFTVVVTDSTHLDSTPATVVITVRASGQ
ncbi:MAG TPA: hypothetical protein VMT89_03280 [Candidatus Acidoferrales bacterium]|nr:hypothetical protein [Candidatus Acidoferrales bacterium]